MFWVEGESQQTIDILDRSFQYGDGCFTTMLVRDGQIQHFHDHQHRVDECLKALRISALDWDVVRLWLDTALQHIQHNSLHETKSLQKTNKPHSEKAGIKLHVSRGSGGRGYSTKNIAKPTVTISTFDFPSHYSAWQDSGVELGVCQQALGLGTLLAGHKHNNRLEQILMKDEMEQANEVDGVVLDISGNVIETTMANLFWRKGQAIHTPQLTQSGVAGVMRKQVLTALNQAELSVTISDYCLSQLMQADEVFMTNSILGVAPVTRISDTQFNIGTVTRSLQGQLNS
ncbi:aminodeoxychorismate lyase [Vibrio sp. 10N.261.46.E12]|uniref:aminodeoxychorismate lyase n=1 Tax=unclassified Vibrio TaxID=2614977 RepID=UPI0009781351|nr:MULTISPECIES: aminodeoxychorismate lyase [unclassified Vibrio]OMO32767.1 aminodeoxychorismate lyase [Vibrio sp. 10N.261.45.E1]PMJ27109.1 aminodeoxychorismate lyase [Vibrio sp. 10N.286.45.B6]PML87804.1 aminodeoxychorismate lyase [Vibrio sp. 10N.261.49.E11]PMM73128.1 aminodeoxychorismate lyase [Vibrio sp. 10N.261.46.F12]PMM82179.1 aminodeoxychorismate lyase [Vibrio sp. 10N.261.46.E8]